MLINAAIYEIAERLKSCNIAFKSGDWQYTTKTSYLGVHF